MVADRLSALMVVLVGLVAVAVLAFGLADASREEERNGHHPLTHALLAGICGAFLTGDIFNMYVWFEVMLIASFGLLVIGGGRDELDGAMKYVGLNLIATVAFISGVGLLYGATGALNMADLHGRLDRPHGRDPDPRRRRLPHLRLRLQGRALPALLLAPRLLPHPLLRHLRALLRAPHQGRRLRPRSASSPSSSPSPAPRSRPSSSGAPSPTMVVGVLGSLAMTGVRRVLGFSIISSIGYMILGLAVATPLALVGAVFYLAQDVVVKANLFLAAGAARRLTGSELFARSGGIWRQRPWFSLLFLVPALSLAGVPPFSGFWAKLLLAKATLDAGRFGLTFAVLAVGLLTLFAMARVWSEAFWDAHPDGPEAITEPLPLAMWAPLAVLTAHRGGGRRLRRTLRRPGARGGGGDRRPGRPTSRRSWGRGHDPLAVACPGAGRRPSPATSWCRAYRWRRRSSRPAAPAQPRFVTVPLAEARSDLEITMVANYITLTPGTLTVDVSPDRSTLLVHALLAGETGDDVRADIREGIEPRVVRVTRP